VEGCWSGVFWAKAILLAIRAASEIAGMANLFMMELLEFSLAVAFLTRLSYVRFP
jgi:hypothetical protein